MVVNKYALAFFAPLVATSFLSTFSELSPVLIAAISVALVVVLSLFSVVGKLVRNDPNERVSVAVAVGLASGLLAVASAFAIEVANPFIVLTGAMGAAYKGPEYLKSKTEDKKDK
jgi:hypothetical protein